MTPLRLIHQDVDCACITAHPDTTFSNSRSGGAPHSPVAAVQTQFLAVGQYDALKLDDLLAVGELIANGDDHSSSLHRGFAPQAAVEGGTPRQHPVGEPT